MQQAQDLLALMRCLKCDRPDLSMGMYSGYAERELDAGTYWTHHGAGQDARCRTWVDIRSHLDFAVLGRFVAAKSSSLPLSTSVNQSLRLFSDRYREFDFHSQECEVQIAPDGLVQITGFPLAGSPA